ncbi:MAG TPA: DUF507 family protein [Thermodesulfovibrionales bacterium]|nr:DUF507 family protein [Thermodesulfovibrionales bacterium]
MRIPKSWVPVMAKRIVDNLIAREMIKPKVPVEKLVEQADAILLDELMVEDRLNDEVRVLLKKHETDIERNRMDYRKLFELTKQKLVKERNLVL